MSLAGIEHETLSSTVLLTAPFVENSLENRPRRLQKSPGIFPVPLSSCSRPDGTFWPAKMRRFGAKNKGKSYLKIGLFDLFRGGSLLQTEGLVVVFFQQGAARVEGGFPCKKWVKGEERMIQKSSNSRAV